MRSRFLPFAALFALSLGVLGAACGLDFSDLGEQPEAGSPVPTGTTTPTATNTTTDGTAPQQDGASELDATTILDASLPLDAGDARPPPTSVLSRITFRFELNYICFDGFNPLNCTRNEGTFSSPGRFRGASAAFLGSPGGTGTNVGRLELGASPSANAVDIDDGTDVIPVGAAPTKLTLAAWVKRADNRREDARIVSLAPFNTGMPIFEMGFRTDTETRLQVSIGEPLESGQTSSQAELLVKDVWTFVAATYDGGASSDHLCFYRGTEAVAVARVGCMNYPGRTITRRVSRFSVGNAANEATRTASKNASFPGSIDNVFVFVGDALDLAELEKLRSD
jgi:hypothetical protein